MKDIVNNDRGPKPIGPYSQGVKINGLLYLSGQIPLDPKTRSSTEWSRRCNVMASYSFANTSSVPNTAGSTSMCRTPGLALS